MSLSSLFVAGQPLTAAQLNGLLVAWDAYTPAATNFGVGNGSLTGRSYRQGKTAAWRVNFTAGSTSTYSGSPAQISLPYAAAAGGAQMVPIYVGAAGINYLGFCYIFGGASVGTLYVPESNTGTRYVGITSTSIGPGTNGSFLVQGAYEAA